MSSQEENLTVAREGLAAYQSGDFEAFLDFLDPEVETVSPPDLPNPVRTTGRDGYVQWISRWLDAWEKFDVEALHYEPVGERHVVVDVIQHGIGKESGIEVEMRAFYMLEIEDGMATRVHLFADREQALDAARAGEGG